MLFGPDISNYQRGIDLARVRVEGFDFVIAKATQGDSYRSPDYPRQRDQAIKNGLIFAAYHYIDTSDPDAQARNFLGYSGGRQIACMFDWEKGSGNGAWLRQVVAAFARAGVRCALNYAPRWYWQSVGSPSLAGLPATVGSSYPSTKSGAASALYTSVGANRWAPYGGQNVAVLQFTDRAQIAGMQIDCNAYPGTREQLISLLYGNPVAPARATIDPEELVSGQTYFSASGNIQVDAECGPASQVFAKAYVIVLIPTGSAEVTVYPGNDKGTGAKMVKSLNKDAGARRAVFEMPDGNTDACVQWQGASAPVTVKTIYVPKKV